VYSNATSTATYRFLVVNSFQHSATTHNAMVQTSLSSWLTKAKSTSGDIVPLEESSFLPEEKRSTLPSPPLPDSAPTHSKEAEKDVEIISSNAIASPKKTITWGTRPLPPNAAIVSITAETLAAFRRMTSLLLPVPYPDKFYKEILTDHVASNISLVCVWTEPHPSDPSATTTRVVSGIRGRLLACSPAAQTANENASPEGRPCLYISTVTTLAPYRGHGLAGALLRRVIARAIRDYNITTVTAHMWEANEDASEWYANHGFKQVSFHEQYYRRLKPSGAWLLERSIGPQDLL
jgi:ribosomal protein S18 acetylase RimI-like enzyme